MEAKVSRLRNFFQSIHIDRVLFLTSSFVLLFIELLLVERKHAIFSGGFGQSRVIDTIDEFVYFVPFLIIIHVSLATCIWILFRWLHRNQLNPLLFRLNWILIACGFFVLTLNIKFEVLNYFSDAISWQLIQNLGGGSLLDAVLYGLDEGILIIVSIIIAFVIYLFCIYWIRKYPANISITPKPILAGWRWVLPILSAPFFIFFANGGGIDVSYGLNKFTSYNLITSILDQATDFDNDGYGFFSLQIDRQPFDPSRHPLAYDIPENGIDEDGFSGDFIPHKIYSISPTLKISTRHPPHLILVIIESARADILNKRINGKLVAPNLQKLAEQGSVIHESYSHTGYTTESLKSIFTGKLHPPDAGTTSLFYDLKAKGYRIGIFSGQPEDFGDISDTVGMRKNSDVYVDAETLKNERAFSFSAKGSLLVDESKLLREFEHKIAGNVSTWERPTFLYFNFQSPHFPYHHPGMENLTEPNPIPRNKINKENQAWVARTYWNAVAYSDKQLGKLVARLKELGVWENTVFAVTGDHGEDLFEDGYLGHGHIINSRQFQTFLVINKQGYSNLGPIGLRDYLGILYHAMGSPQTPEISRPIFQHVGSLETPAVIGMVDKGSVFTTLKLDTREVWFSDLNKRMQYDSLPEPLLKRADSLVYAWETERWLMRSQYK